MPRARNIMKQKIGLITLLLMMPVLNAAIAQDVNPGDGVRVSVYNITDTVSGDYYVQHDGTIQLPYIGLIFTRGRVYDNIREEIIARYENIYRNPEITVQPLYKVNLLGEVHSPGVYYVTGVEKLSDLLAAANGETEAANLRNIYLIRDHQKIEIDAVEILQNGQRFSDLGLRSGDDIYVPRKPMMSFRNASVLLSAAALIVTTIGVITQ